MKNFANVKRYREASHGVIFSVNGNFVYYKDYEELLNAHRTLIDKMSEVVGDATFEE